MSLISLLLTAMVLHNVVAYHSLGIASHLEHRKAILPVGTIIAFNTMVSSLIAYFVFLFSKSFIANTVSVIIVNILLSILMTNQFKKLFPVLYQELDFNVEILILNSVLIGVSLLGITKEYNLFETFFYSLGSGIGYMLMSYLFHSLISELNNDPIPKPLRGWPLYLIVLGFISLIFSRF